MSSSARVARRYMGGVFQAPPKLTEDIIRWAGGLYAGSVLAQVQDKLEMARDSEKLLLNALREVEATKRDLARSVQALEKGEIHRWTIYNFTTDGKLVPELFGIRHEFTGLMGETRYALARGDKRLTFKKYPLTLVFDRIMEQANSSVNWSLERIPIKLDQLRRGVGTTDDPTLVEMVLLQKECLKWTSKAKMYKTKAATVMPVDITGWRYLDVVLADLNKRVTTAKTWLEGEITRNERWYAESVEEFEAMTSPAVVEAVETQTLNPEAERIFKKFIMRWTGWIPTKVSERVPKMQGVPIGEDFRQLLGIEAKDQGFLSAVMGEGWNVPYITVEEAKKLNASLVPITMGNVNKQLVRMGWGEINVILFFQPHTSRGGQWAVGTRTLQVDVPTPEPKTVEQFRDSLSWLGRITRHEVQHVGQDLIKVLTPAKEHGGLPSPSIRDPKVDPMGYDRTQPVQWSRRKERWRQDHAVQDIEFATRLADEIFRFKHIARKIPINKRREAMHIWTASARGILKIEGLRVQPAEFFVALKSRQRGKWRKAVSEFVAAVQKVVKMASTDRVVSRYQDRVAANPFVAEPTTKLKRLLPETSGHKRKKVEEALAEHREEQLVQTEAGSA